MGIFAGTAEAYDTFRPGAPAEVVDFIMSHVRVPVTLLDLGCGTGRITEQFAPYFDQIICVEPEAEMAKFARKRFEGQPVTVLHERAEDMKLPEGFRASLVLISRAFHWMDRSVVLARLEHILANDGVLVVMSDYSYWHLQEPWAEIVRETLKEYLGERRRTILGTYQAPGAPFESDLENTSFLQMTSHTIPVVRTWTTDQILGYLESTSFASRRVLGEKAGAFADELRKKLLQLSPGGMFTEHNEFTILLAKRVASES